MAQAPSPLERLRHQARGVLADNARRMDPGSVDSRRPAERATAREPPRDGWSGPQMGATEGVAAYGGANGLRAAQTRLAYVDPVSRLDRNDSAGREALKAYWREKTPAPQRGVIQAVRPGLGAPSGTSGSANHTNPLVTRQALAMAWLGHASLVGSAILGAGEIATSRDKPKAMGSVAGAELGGWAGGVAGAETGALIGAAFGPGGVPVGALIGGIAGSLGGGAAGHAAGGGVVDAARRLGRR